MKKKSSKRLRTKKLSYDLGGDLLKGVADLGLSTLGMGNIIPDNAYDNSKIGKAVGVAGKVTGVAAPIAANIIAPGSGQIISAAQKVGTGVNPQTQQYLTPEQIAAQSYGGSEQSNGFADGGKLPKDTYYGVNINQGKPQPIQSTIKQVPVFDPGLAGLPQVQVPVSQKNTTTTSVQQAGMGIYDQQGKIIMRKGMPVVPAQYQYPGGYELYYKSIGLGTDGKVTPTGNINTYVNSQPQQKAYGGNLTEYNAGGTHETNPNGGIPIGDSLVEQGETRNNDYIFSDRLKFRRSKKTFAQESKRIENSYKKTTDPLRLEAKEKRLNDLMNTQEILKSTIINKSIKKVYGGGINPQTGSPEDMYNDYYNNINPEFNAMQMNQYGLNANLQGNNSIPLNTFVGPQDPNNVQYRTTPTNNANKTIGGIGAGAGTSAGVTDTTQQGLQGTLPYWAMGVQALGPLSELAYGLKGGDKVNFQRVKPKMLDSTNAKLSADTAIQRAYNSGNSNLRNNNLTSGQYRTNRLISAGSEALKRGQTAADIQGQYDNSNIQIANQADQMNAGIQMQEAIATQQEKDAARTYVTQGLGDLGNIAGGISRDIGMNNSQNMIAQGLMTGEYMINKNGKVVKIKKYGGSLRMKKNC